MNNNSNSNNNNNNSNDNRLAEMLAYANSLAPRRRNNQNFQREELIFGEELPGYYPIAGEEREFERDQFDSVKALSNKITMQLYGESKFGEDVKGLYAEIVSKRKAGGFPGLRGKNKKGILCAILMIVLRQNGINIELNTLINAANKIYTNTANVTARMILNYMHFILELLQLENNNHERKLNVRKDLRRMGIKFGYTGRNLATLVKKSDSIKENIYSYHTPHIISAAILYDNINAENRTKNTYKNIGVSKQSLLTALKRIFPNKSWNSEFASKRKTSKTPDKKSKKTKQPLKPSRSSFPKKR